MRIKALTFLVASFIMAASATAQVEVCTKRWNDIGTRFNYPPTAMTPDQTQQYISDNISELISVDLDCFLWDSDMHTALAKFETPGKPKFAITSASSIGTNFSTPYVDSNNVINIPQEFPFYLFAMSSFLAHDAYVKDRLDSFEPTSSLSDTPCRRTMMIPLLTPFFNFIRLNAYMQVRGIVACRFDDQQRILLENFAEVITPAFMLLHENAHQRLGHPLSQVHTLEQELAADASALAALQIMREQVVQGLPDDTVKRIRWMFKMAPVLWLYADAERVHNADADARLSAAIKSDPDMANQFGLYIKPSRNRWGPRVYHLAFDHQVNYYVVDGLRLEPDEIPSTGLLMNSGLHAVVAMCPDGIAFSRSTGDPDYTFMPFAEQAGAIAAAVAKDDSEEIILKGTTVDFNPISPTIAWPWVSAVHSLRWAAWISDDVIHQLNPTQQNTVRGWQAAEAQLGPWR